MSLNVICKNVEISSLQLGERVVCFYPEDDFPHVGVLSHLPFEMPDGMKYFAIDDDLSGSTMFPVLGGRCYHAPSIVNDFVKQPFAMGMCVCINKEKWGFCLEFQYMNLVLPTEQFCILMAFIYFEAGLMALWS